MAIPLTCRTGTALARGGDARGRGGGDGSDGRGRGDGGSRGKGEGDTGREGSGSAARGAAERDRESRRNADDAQENSTHYGSDASRPEQLRGLSVTHGNGIAEEVDSGGRYVMRDNRGRTIVDRAATKADVERLRSLLD